VCKLQELHVLNVDLCNDQRTSCLLTSTGQLSSTCQLHSSYSDHAKSWVSFAIFICSCYLSAQYTHPHTQKDVPT